MPSTLRLQSSFEEPIEAQATYHSTSPALPPKKKQRMSLTNTYLVASTARSKLGREAGRSDHNLRRLVGHANLLDSLMLELQEAEREQEAWFNQAVRKASKPEEPRRAQWMDQIAEVEDGESSDDEDEGSEFDESEPLFDLDRPIRIHSAPVEISSRQLEDEDEDLDADYDEESDDEELALRRSPSNKNSPPELEDDSDSESESDSEDECPSPEDTPLQLSEKQRQAIATTAFYDIKSQQGLEHYVLQQPQATIIAAC